MGAGSEVVIIGSGMGGLVCGALLSKEGYRVTVLERNKQIGGNLQTFARDKRIFDSGVHYVGGLDKGQNLYKIFTYLGFMDKLRLQKLEEDAFDKIIFYSDGKEYSYAQGYPKFISTLVKEFPGEEKAIRTYCEAMQRICENFPLYNIRMGNYVAKSGFLEIDTKAYIASLTDNVRLQNVLAGNNGLYAGMPDKTPLYVHALVLNSYVESSYRFVDGGSQLTKHLTRIILENGGTVKNRSEVKKINVNGNEADYVETTDGIRYYGDYFISNAHPAQTLELTDTEIIRPAYRHRVLNLENSVSAFVINISMKPGMFKYQKTNYYCFLNDDVWDTMEWNDDTWPTCYALFFSASSKSEEYAEGITIMAYMKFSEVEKWKTTFNTTIEPNDRDQEYQEFKRKKAEKLLDLAEKKFPGLRAAILSYYTATPLTFRDYMGTDDGSIYGIAKNYKDPLKTFISPRTKIKNLLLTGQNINLHGILGVTVSALVTCSEILGMQYIIDKINDAQVEQVD